MTDRNKVAAATAAVVPFHCVICFDEFSVHERWPVVLPCGHTYVCHPCSQRLKRCMECRHSLCYSAPTSSSPHKAAAAPLPPNNYQYYQTGRSTGRYSPSPATPPPSSQSSSSQPPHPTVPPPPQLRFPTPKNVVLLSMMEAAARQASAIATHQDDTSGSMTADDDGDEYDLTRILGSMATLSGPCGTYAVQEDLPWVMTDPGHSKCMRLNFSASEDESTSMMEATTAVGEQSQAPPDADDTDGGSTIATTTTKKPPAPKRTLVKGQTVQVVQFDNGIAKLARGAGFVLARPSQLVKIGEPQEKTCRLEGLLETVANRGRDLQKELDDNERIEASLRREICVELRREPNHPVITEPPKPPAPEPITPVTSNDEDEEDYPVTPNFDSRLRLQQPDLRTPEPASPQCFRLDENGLAPYGTRYGAQRPFPLRSPNSIDNSDLRNAGLPTYRCDDEPDFIYGCGSAILGPGNSLFASQHSPRRNALVQQHANNDNVVADSHRLRSLSTDSTQQINLLPHHPSLSTTPTSSFETVDFRTGMSGHRGLSNSKLNPGLSPTPRGQHRSLVMKMSSHAGIGRVRGPRVAVNSQHHHFAPTP